MCGNTHVSRLPSGPMVKRSGDSGESTSKMMASGMAEMIRAMAEMAKNSEDVAERFPEEARRMHYGETEPRSIRGQATLDETREMLEEGIAVLPVPFPAKENLH